MDKETQDRFRRLLEEETAELRRNLEQSVWVTCASSISKR